MLTLGINAAFHDSSAVLVDDGKVVFAQEEERYTRIKHAKRPIPFSAYELPFHAINACLKAAGIDLRDINHIAYSFDPFLRLGPYANSKRISLPLEPSAHPIPEEWEAAWDPLFLASIVNAPRHLVGGVPHPFKRKWAGVRPDGPFHWHFIEHHLAHAASAFLPSPFENAAIVTIDGRGELATTTFSVGEGCHIERLSQVNYPNSIGLLYEGVTEHLGFLPSSDEYKVMAMASFGRPVFKDVFRNMIRMGNHGTYTLQPVDLKEVLGPSRAPGEPLMDRHMDVARSLQDVLEEVVLEILLWVFEKTKAKNLCLAGGVALNCVLNSAIKDRGPFERVWVQPAAGDAGTALGAALWVDAKERGFTNRCEVMEHAYLGPSYSDSEIQELLDFSKVGYSKPENRLEILADLLASGKILGWFEGRSEFGPRALGARSILASPIVPEMKERLNALKDREDFRPVAPCILKEEAPRWFLGGCASPFMLFTFPVRPEQAHKIPAALHVDGTARIQTVTSQHNPSMYDLIQAFARRTGIPILINTSFNTKGEPIVLTPEDALRCFFSSPLDALSLGPFLIVKS